VAQSAPDANDMVTATLVCSNVPAGTYELLVDPFFFVACDFDMCGSTTPCAATLPTGACVSGSFTVSPTSVVSETGGGGSGSSDSADKMTGGGHVDRYQDDQFALEVWEGMTNPKGQVRFATKGNTCVLRSTQLSYAVVSRTATGGHAEFDGWAEVRTKSGGRTQGHFHGYADDNGEGSSKGDRFRLTEAPDGCLNTDDVVTRGNVQAHAVA
jgi:hypothetical protein